MTTFGPLPGPIEKPCFLPRAEVALLSKDNFS
jgi:hypothetical protein